jgi:hypothetical protein
MTMITMTWIIKAGIREMTIIMTMITMTGIIKAEIREMTIIMTMTTMTGIIKAGIREMMTIMTMTTMAGIIKAGIREMTKIINKTKIRKATQAVTAAVMKTTTKRETIKIRINKETTRIGITVKNAEIITKMNSIKTEMMNNKTKDLKGFFIFKDLYHILCIICKSYRETIFYKNISMLQ